MRKQVLILRLGSKSRTAAKANGITRYRAWCYAEQSSALSALQNAGISSAAIENTGVLSIQNVTGHSGFDPSILISIVLGYSLSPSSEQTVIFSVIVVIS